MLGHQANIREIHRSKIDAMEKEDINMSFVQQKTCIAVDIGASAGELKEGKCEKTSFIGLPAQSSSRRPLFPWRGNTTLGSISTNFQIVRSTSNIFLESSKSVFLTSSLGVMLISTYLPKLMAFVSNYRLGWRVELGIFRSPRRFLGGK